MECKAPPRISSGAQSSPRARISAPIFRNGSTTRRMGRLRKEASPDKVEVKDWPASTPASMRIVVPEFSASTVRCGCVVQYFAAALRKRRNNRVAMRHGLIAGKLDHAFYGSAGRYRFVAEDFRHRAILAWADLLPMYAAGII